MKDFSGLRKIIEALPDSEVQIRNDTGDWGGKGTSAHAFVSEYLRSLERRRDEESRATALSISREANSIALKALRIAKSDRIIAIIAIMFSIIAIFIQIIQ